MRSISYGEDRIHRFGRSVPTRHTRIASQSPDFSRRSRSARGRRAGSRVSGILVLNERLPAGQNPPRDRGPPPRAAPKRIKGSTDIGQALDPVPYPNLAPELIWWSRTESNRRPLQCHCSALPTELRPLGNWGAHDAAGVGPETRKQAWRAQVKNRYSGSGPGLDPGLGSGLRGGRRRYRASQSSSLPGTTTSLTPSSPNSEVS